MFCGASWGSRPTALPTAFAYRCGSLARAAPRHATPRLARSGVPRRGTRCPAPQLVRKSLHPQGLLSSPITQLCD